MQTHYVAEEESIEIQCPYCGEWIELELDLSTPEQAYIEDCQVCCRPVDVRLSGQTDGAVHVTIARDDD